MKNKIFRNMKHKSNFIIMLVLFIVIVLGVNLLITVTGKKIPLNIDLTANKLYAFAEQTQEVTKALTEDINIYVLVAESKIPAQQGLILTKYAQSSKHIKLQYIDPAINTTFGQKYIDELGTSSLGQGSIIVEKGNKFKLLDQQDLVIIPEGGEATDTLLNMEAKVTSAIMYVNSKEEFNVAFAVGHGEAIPKYIKTALEDDNYGVKELALLTEDIAENIKTIICFEPTRDYSQEVIAKLDAFTAKGGKVQFYISPIKETKFDNVNGFIGDWGMTINDNVVIEGDTSKLVQLQGGSLALPAVSEHAIAGKIASSGLNIGAYINRSIEIKNVTGKKTTPLLQLSKESFSYTDYEKRSISTYQEGDKKGIHTIAALSEDAATGGAVMMVGSGLLLDDNFSALPEQLGFANKNLFLNSVNFMENKEETGGVAIRPKALVTEKIVIEQSHQDSLKNLFMFIIPGILLLAGVIIWYRRRNL